MTVVFSFLHNCSGCKDDDFRDEGKEVQHVGPETAKAREPNVTVFLYVKNSDRPGLQPACDDERIGGVSAVKEPGHFEVRTSSSQVTRMHFFPQQS